MILYPTETLYALGANACDPADLLNLYELKDRGRGKAASWLVRNREDIQQYAELPPCAAAIAAHFLPGPLTLVLKAKIHIPNELVAEDRTIGFRISSDPVAAELIADFMAKNNAPLTCTSANISGAPTLATPGEILQQFGPRANMIETIVDDGPRKGLATTIVRVIGGTVTILREGDITEAQILSAIDGEVKKD